MIEAEELLFRVVKNSPGPISSVCRWKVSIADGVPIADITERRAAIPYYIEISGQPPKHLVSRKDVMDYILAVLNR